MQGDPDHGQGRRSVGTDRITVVELTNAAGAGLGMDKARFYIAMSSAGTSACACASGSACAARRLEPGGGGAAGSAMLAMLAALAWFRRRAETGPRHRDRDQRMR